MTVYVKNYSSNITILTPKKKHTSLVMYKLVEHYFVQISLKHQNKLSQIFMFVASLFWSHTYLVH